jgi:hypothetical protein
MSATIPEAEPKLDEAAIQARTKLAAYEKVVRQVQGGCPPIFHLAGIETLFAGRRLEDLVRRPFAGKCTIREKGKTE